MREGFEPDVPEAHNPERVHNLDYPFTTEEGKDDNKDLKPPIDEEASQWESRDYTDADDSSDRRTSPQYGSFREERNVWGDD